MKILSNTAKQKFRYTLIFIGLVMMFLSLSSSSFAQESKYPKSDTKYAFDGYDLVSYFMNDRPAKGNSVYQLKFSSKKNLEIFKTNPAKFLPAYGGYCATAITMDTYIIPDYNQYKIQDDKLLFFEVKAFFNGRTQWEKNPELNKIISDKNYQQKFNNIVSLK